MTHREICERARAAFDGMVAGTMSPEEAFQKLDDLDGDITAFERSELEADRLEEESELPGQEIPTPIAEVFDLPLEGWQNDSGDIPTAVPEYETA